MCICFGWRGVNIQCLLRWKIVTGKSFWLLLVCVTMTLECKKFMEFYSTHSFALCWFSHTRGLEQEAPCVVTCPYGHSVSGVHPLPKASPLQAPLHRLLRQLGEDSTLQAQWPSGIKHWPFNTSTAGGPSTPAILCPSVGTTEEKPPGIDERKLPWL